MDINRTNLDNLFITFSGKFNGALAGFEPLWNRVAMLAPSSSRENQYGWLRQLKAMREWVGDRVVDALEKDGYRIANKPFENTVGVDRDDIADDQVGMYGPMFEDLGQSAAEQPDVLVFALLAAAFTTVCYDGQYFIDSDHPVIAADGSATTYSNTGGGGGTPWFLFCTNRPVKPLIYQERQKAQLVRMDNPTDPNVFHKKQFLYGVDMRGNVGFGLPQLAYGSKQTLDATNYELARANIMGRVGEKGRKLNLKPDLLVVPPSLEGAARRLLMNDTLAAGGTNEWYKTADVLVAPLL